MSLIRVRRKRKKEWIDTQKGRSTKSLLAFLALVVIIIWYLSFRF